MERERRKRVKQEAKVLAFEKFKQVKIDGCKHKCEVGDVENIYEEVSEKEYTERVLKRREEDFIVSDGLGNDYVEDGREIFDDDLDEESIQKELKSKKRKRHVSSKVSEVPKGNIERLIAKMPARKDKPVELDTDEILADLFQEVNAVVEKRKKISNGIKDEKTATQEYLKNFEAGPVIKSLPKANSRKQAKEDSAKEPEITLTQQSENKCETMKDVMGYELFEDVITDEFDIIFDQNEVQVENMTPEVTTSVLPGSVLKCDLELERDIQISEKLSNAWESMNVDIENEISNVNVNFDDTQLPLHSCNDDKKVFKFFLWDAYEDIYSQPGTVFLFGKVRVEFSQMYVSCCVSVKDIPRRLYLLPREKNQTTGEDVKLIDVYHEFNNKIAEKYKIMKFKTRKVTKNYAFSIPNIPDTSDYLEVLYSAIYDALPANLQGDTFSHVFGTNTSYLEQFLIGKKIKGACWLNVQDAIPSSKRISWCKFDIDCNDMDNITVCKDGGHPPPLVVMAINLLVTPIQNSHENQVTMIGCLIHHEYHTDKSAPKPHFQQHFCAFTKPTDIAWPYDFQGAFSKFNKIKMDQKYSERELLEFFLAKYYRIDPDLVVGHDILGFDIGTLVRRLVVNKVYEPSRLGRLHRRNMTGTGKNRNFIERNVMCGRLLCDVKISAKELIRARSYDLNSLCEQVLHIKEGERKEIKTEEVKAMYCSSQSVVELVKLTMQDVHCILRIMYELNVIPLFLQITNIAGNVLSRTLMGGRSERNEFLLLHAFSDRDYIVPDKIYAKKVIKNEAGDEEVEVGPKSKRKPQYEGGLVLEPKKGFYDKLILLMDFNSLYPSIIQEYNICFTTISVRGINLSDEGHFMALLEHIPCDSSPGILPIEIKKLVDSRREVKKLMSQQDITEDLKHQYNIRQLALKLTANSMYGCLGFPNSRFYAKPLAAIVTAKGREVLVNTRDLVHKLNYDVIYGDTDSLMINTNSVVYEDVFNIGKKIKFEVNKLYKQIELDIDSVFKYMLLLKKKKYAAVAISKLNGKIVTKEEIKGLDMVRRDWSQLSAEAGKFVLSQILSDQNIDDKIANIHDRLRKLKIDLDENRVPIPLLAITKQLTKNPKDYPDKKVLPHVQVAIRMNNKMSKKFKQGDTIAYVICEDGTINAATQRAYHVDELKSREDLKIDVKYYLSQQIHPVVSRLCEPIDGIDAIPIAESLGLDVSAYQHIRRMDNEINEEDQICIDDSDRFKSCDSFEFKCMNPQCGAINVVEGPAVKNDAGNYTFVLDRCANKNCNEKPFNYVFQLQNVLWLKLRFYIHRYYSRWMVCDDSTCGYRTRDIRSYNKNLEVDCPQCRRTFVIREYTESQLFNQLCYFQYMFDITNAISKNKALKKDKDDPSFQAYVKLNELVDVVLKANAYNIIDLSKICELLMMK